MPKEVIDATPHLKIVANYGAGYDNIDYKYAGEKGIAVTNTPKVSTEATAELTFALLLARREFLKGIRYVVRLDLTDGHRYFS